MIKFTRVVARDCFAYSLLDFTFEAGIHSIEGLNGSAKTSIFMTLMQGLFNRNAKGTRIEEVNNTITGKPYEIEVYFEKDKDDYLVVNSRKAGTIEIFKNGKPKHVKRIPDNLKIIEDILGVDFSTFQDLVYQSPKSSINLLEKDSDASRKAFINNILKLDEIDSSLDKFKTKDKELSGKNGQLEMLQLQIRKYEESVVEDYETEQDEIDLTKLEGVLADLNKSRDTQQIEMAKTRTTLTALKEDKQKCDSLSENQEHITELEKYLKKVKISKETLQELTEQKSSLQLQKQDVLSDIKAQYVIADILERNKKNQAKKDILLTKLGNCDTDIGSVSALSEKLRGLTRDSATLATEIKSNENSLTKLLEYSTMGTCPTCNQTVAVDSFKDEISQLLVTLETDNAKLDSVKININLMEQALKESKQAAEINHTLEVVEASFEECIKTEKDVEDALAKLARVFREVEDNLTNISERIETRQVYEESQQELARLKAIPGAQFDKDTLVSQIDKLTEHLRTLRDYVDEIEDQIQATVKTIKQHQEFNTVQRTIKAVNTQKRTYNEATKAKLDGLYKELSIIEDSAALVKTWLHILGPKGFRVHKMQSFLGHLNASMKKYSDMLSDGKIRCMFYMTEGEIDFTVTDCNKTIAWSCWSEGEKARVKMACLFAVLELLEVMGAVSFNVLALDEIFSALDHAGKEGLFRVLNYLKDRGKCLYTIAHTQLVMDKEYTSVIRAYKQDDGTTTITQ